MMDTRTHGFRWVYPSMLRMPYYIMVCVLILLVASGMHAVYAQQPNAAGDESDGTAGDTVLSIASETDRATVLFSTRGDIYTFSDIVDNYLYKGMTLYFDVKANLRYAVVSRSTTIDTLQRLIIKNISVYKDLYLGEDAGIIFTPDQDEQVILTVFATGKLDGTYTAKEGMEYRMRTSSSSDVTRQNDVAPIRTQDMVRAVPLDSDDTLARNVIAGTSLRTAGENVKLGEYLVWVYQLPSNVAYTRVPFNTDATLSEERMLAQRIADEYRLALDERSRLYVRMESQVFDSLLEVSDRYGRAIVSDDWGDEYSLVTLEVSTTDDYFVTATSFDGLQTGDYQLEVRVSANELIEDTRGQITPSSPKILQKYAYEYELNIGRGVYRAVEIQPLDAVIDFALVNDALRALYYETIPQGEKRIIPLYVAEDGNYKLLLLSAQPQVSNFIFRVFQ